MDHNYLIKTYYRFRLILLCFMCCGLAATTFSAQAALMPVLQNPIVLNSNSFNAQKRSSFTIAGLTEHLNRGLTLISFNTIDGYEFRTFDTHASKEDAKEFMDILTAMEQNDAQYIIVGHDSASKSLQFYSEKLKQMGFDILGNLQSRQAYIMYKSNGEIRELVDDLTIRLELPMPKNLTQSTLYFPKPTWEFEPRVDRYIAHAAGEVDGIKSTNSREALDANYKKGFRLFELDIIETSDGKLVAAHDWNMWARFTDYKGPLPASHAVFQKHKIYGKYSTLDMPAINAWFAAHPDAILVTDKLNDPIRFAEEFIDSQRLIMELFSFLAIEEAANKNISAMISQETLQKIKGDKLAFLSINKIKYVAVSRRIIAANKKLMLQLRDAGIKVYVYNVNFDPGKDEKYVLDHEIGLVYGMYADTWIFDNHIPQ